MLKTIDNSSMDIIMGHKIFAESQSNKISRHNKWLTINLPTLLMSMLRFPGQSALCKKLGNIMDKNSLKYLYHAYI